MHPCIILYIFYFQRRRSPVTATELDEILQRVGNWTEAERQQALRDLNEIHEETERMVCTAKNTVQSLRLAAYKLDEYWKDCTAARAFGTGAAIVGGLLTLAGGIATVMSAGTAVPLLVFGTVVGGAGTGTNVVARLLEASKNSEEIKKAEKDLKQTLKNINDVNNTVRKWLNRKDKASVLFTCRLALHTFELTDPVVKILQNVASYLLSFSPEVLKGCMALGPGAAPVAEAAKQVAEATVKAGIQSADDAVGVGAKVAAQGTDDAVAAGVKGSSKLAGKIIIGVSAVFLVVDTIDLAITINELIEEKGSDAARILRQKAHQLDKMFDQTESSFTEY